MEIAVKFKESNFSYLIKIKADSGFFSQHLDLLRTSFLNCYKRNPSDKKANFTIHLQPFYDHHGKRCRKKNEGSLKVRMDTKYRIFSFSTPHGSFIKGNFVKGFGVGRIVEWDNYKYVLLCAFLRYCYLYNFSVRIHAATFGIGNKGFLFIGNSGAGKSTLSGLLKDTRDFKLIDDDEGFVISTPSNSYILSFTPEDLRKDNLAPFQPCSSLFFVELHKKQKSKLSLISKKEAFKRIVFLSEFPGYENDAQKVRRIENLTRLISHSKCFSLINGNDLRDNPNQLKSLLRPALI